MDLNPSPFILDSSPSPQLLCNVESKSESNTSIKYESKMSPFSPKSSQIIKSPNQKTDHQIGDKSPNLVALQNGAPLLGSHSVTLLFVFITEYI